MRQRRSKKSSLCCVPLSHIEDQRILLLSPSQLLATIIITSIYLASYQCSHSYTSHCLLSHSPVGRSCILLNHLYPLGVCHLFTFTYVAKITRDLSFSSVSHSSLYNPLGSTCAHLPRVSSDTLAETSNTSAWTFFSDGRLYYDYL